MASSIDGVVWRGLLALVLASCQLRATARAASVALVVPLHPPRYDQAAGLVSSYVQHNLSASLDVYFVLAQSDLGSFGEALGEPAGVVVLPFGGDKTLAKGREIFHKKWWAVEHLLERTPHYKFFWIVDTEIRFLKAVDAHDAAREIWATKKLYAAATSIFVKLVRDEMDYFSTAADRQTIMEKMRNGTLYFWFNEIPTVERETARAFLSELAITSRPAPRNWDILPYYYYLLLRDGWTAVDLTAITGVRGASIGEEGGVNAAAVQLSKPHWATARSFAQHPQWFNECNLIMTFHNDKLL